MELTKEDVNNRINQLRAQREQAIATTHAIEGAIQECHALLNKIEEAENGDGGKKQTLSGVN